MSFLLTVLTILLVLRYLVPFLLRLLLGRLVRQTMRAAGAPTGGFGERPRPQSGATASVRVDYAPPPRKREPRPGGYRGGEYVDFEEVR